MHGDYYRRRSAEDLPRLSLTSPGSGLGAGMACSVNINHLCAKAKVVVGEELKEQAGLGVAVEGRDQRPKGKKEKKRSRPRKLNVHKRRPKLSGKVGQDH